MQGIVDIAAGVVAFLWPAITAVAFVLLIAIWALVSGGGAWLLSGSLSAPASLLASRLESAKTLVKAQRTSPDGRFSASITLPPAIAWYSQYS